MQRRFLDRVLGPLLVAALSASAVFGGRAVLWCPWMQQAVSACCCHEEGTRRDGPAITQAPCCETRVAPSAQAASADVRERMLRAPLAADFVPALAQAFDAKLPVAALSFARERPARAGPGVPLHALH